MSHLSECMDTRISAASALNTKGLLDQTLNRRLDFILHCPAF
jgi:hypothetical protein